MRINAIASVLLLALFGAVPGSAQDNGRSLEQELSNHYIGRTFDTAQPYLNREVWFDQNGEITENPTPVCGGLYGRMTLKRIHVRGGEVDVEVTRTGVRPPNSVGIAVWPSYASREVTLRFKSASDWTVDSFDKAFQNSLRPRGRFEGLPPGTSAPPPGSDPRIAYYFNGSPVYRAGSGVVPPRSSGRMTDPEYTDSARRARAGGIVPLRFIVNEDGSVSDVTYALPALGFGLDQQAARTVQEQWRFDPAMLDGHPVKVEMRAETSFCLY